MLKTYIAKTINRTDLSAEEAREAMNIIMTGQATPVADRRLSGVAAHEGRDHPRNHRFGARHAR